MSEKIGSWWLASQEALMGESVVWSIGANRTQSSDRAVGGLLFLTDRRLLFCPHLLDFSMGGEKWAVDRAQIQEVGKQPRGGDFNGGGLRDRLRVTQKDGRVDLFVVNRLDRVIERLRTALPQRE